MRHCLVLLLAVVFPIAGLTQSVSVTNAMVKVHPSDGPTASTTAEIHAAQNEFEAFQVIVTGPVTGVSATAPTLVGPGGATIPASEVRLYREAYLNITTPSNTEGGTGMWPDALVPDVDEVVNEKRNAFPFDVPAGENRVIWVEVHVPQGQTPGTYTGSLAVSGAGLATSVPVTLLVWNFALPSTSSLSSTFGMSWNAACIAHYGSYEACGFDAGVEQTHLLYARFMLDHRITADVVYTGPASCTGSNCDWTHFDGVYGALFDGTDPNLRLKGAKPTSIKFIWSGGYNPDHYSAWAQHFHLKGWFDRTYDYTCDEPPQTCAWTDINTRAAVVHGADAQFRTLVTTQINDANSNGVTSSINILSPVVNFMDDKVGFGSAFEGNQRANYDPFLASNARNLLWWYQSCMSHGCGGVGGDYNSGWPSFMVDNSASQNRSQGMLSWLYNVSGVLYYETLLHLPTAWDSLYDASFGGNGDGTLLYPGKPTIIGGATDIPVASIRLKMIREGFEDYEYMKLVSDLGDPAFAQSVGHTLYPNVYSSNQTPAAIYNAREQLAQRILQLNGGGGGGTGQLTLTTALALSPASPAVNQATTATFTVTNTGTGPFSVQYFLAGARDPSLANVDFPASTPQTIQPGASYTYSASRSFATAGTYQAWPAYFNGTNWIELAPAHSSFTVQGVPPLFSDNFNRTTGLGANWSVLYGSYSTDGNFAVSGTPPINGNWARLNAALGTDNYAVAADLIIPAGSMFSGVVARSNDPANVDRNLYAAQIATDGTVNLYRRNEWNWTKVGSVAAGIVANTSYNLKLLVRGANPVHLEVWLNGTQEIVFDDSSATQIGTGVPGMENYDPGVKYDNFTVTQQ